MQIHEALATVLKRNGISARSVALEAKLTPSQVSFFLNGKRGMAYENVNSFINALPPVVYQEFCSLLSGVSDDADSEVDKAISVLASAPLSDEQIASVLVIASQRIRQPRATQPLQEVVAVS